MISTFGDDPSKAQPDEVFAIFDVFLNSMMEAQQDNLAAKKRKEEEERRLLQDAEVSSILPLPTDNPFKD